MQERIREKNKSRKLHIGTTQGGLCSFILLPDGIADCEIKPVPVPEWCIAEVKTKLKQHLRYTAHYYCNYILAYLVMYV